MLQDTLNRNRIASAVACFILVAGTAFAQEAQTAAETPAAEQSTTKESEPSDAEKKQATAIAFLALAGIVSCGVLLIAGVVLWGHRLRRIVRTPTRPTSPVDELWYLRHKPKLQDRMPADDESSPEPPSKPEQSE